MIQITLSFNTLDEAIVFLGKQHAVGKVRKAADTDAAAPATKEEVTDKGSTSAPDAAAPTKKRKPRADAGKKRGSYKNVEAPEKTDAVPPPTPPEAPAASTPERNRDLIKGDTITAAPETAAPTTEPEQRDPPPSGPSDAAAPKEADLIAAGDALLNAKGLPAVMELMKSFGVSRLRDLPEDKRAEFIEKATA